jgi:hypothetical protein
MPATAVAAPWYALVAAAIAFVGVLVTVTINGNRAERQRKRDLHARSLGAITAYGEMPYRIRRRTAGAETRARLTDELSLVKAEVDTCQVLLAADGAEKLSDAFDDLYELARTTVGKEAHDAWKAPVITQDAEINQGDLYRRLEDFNVKRGEFADHLRIATLPRHRRAWRWIRSTIPGITKLPGVKAPTTAAQRRMVAPQDLASNGSVQPPDGPPGAVDSHGGSSHDG